MAFDFPSAPQYGQQHTQHNVTYVWNGYGWRIQRKGTTEGGANVVEYTTPGDYTVPVPAGRTIVTIECVGAGGPGCVGAVTGATSELEQYFFGPSAMAIKAWRDLPEPRDDFLNPGMNIVPVPAGATLVTAEVIGGGGFSGGGGGGYAKRVNFPVTGIAELGVMVPAAETYHAGDAVSGYVFVRQPGGGFGEIICSVRSGWNGDHTNQPGWGGEAVTGDVKNNGGKGDPAGGGGGGAAGPTGPGGNASGTAGGVSGGAPAGAGGIFKVNGAQYGGGGGDNGGYGAQGWARLTWTTATPTQKGSGGGGGAYAKRTSYSVSGITALFLRVPDKSITNTLNDGAVAIVQAENAQGTILCLASGGHHGVAQGNGDGLGGDAASSIGDVKYSGGKGDSTSPTTVGGGGGSAASSSGNGNNASGNTGGVSPGYPAGAGGNLEAPGKDYGGGGGSSTTVGAGAGGWIKLSWS